MAVGYFSSWGMVQWVPLVGEEHHWGVAVLEVGAHLEEVAVEEEEASWLQEEAAAAELGPQNSAMVEEVGDHLVDPGWAEDLQELQQPFSEEEETSRRTPIRIEISQITVPWEQKDNITNQITIHPVNYLNYRLI